MNLGALSAKEKRVTGTTYINTRLVLDIVWGHRYRVRIFKRG